MSDRRGPTAWVLLAHRPAAVTTLTLATALAADAWRTPVGETVPSDTRC